jgi:hypothetical protein
MISRLPTIQQEVQQRKLLYMGLYLLIWGEAANLRFMPECLCYIYHHVRSACAHFFSSRFTFSYIILQFINNNNNNLPVAFGVLTWEWLCAGTNLCL